MENKNQSCCTNPQKTEKNSITRGILYSLIPHTFCIAFIIFSIIGAVSVTAFLKNFLVIPYFFEFLMGLSIILATISAIIYLKKTDCLCIPGIKSKWKYLTILYATMILINIGMFTVVFPAMANINGSSTNGSGAYTKSVSMTIAIPCTGHAQLIIDEIKTDNGVGKVEFQTPDDFIIEYDPSKTNPQNIASLEIFKTFRIKSID